MHPIWLFFPWFDVFAFFLLKSLLALSVNVYFSSYMLPSSGQWVGNIYSTSSSWTKFPLNSLFLPKYFQLRFSFFLSSSTFLRLWRRLLGVRNIQTSQKEKQHGDFIESHQIRILKIHVTVHGHRGHLLDSGHWSDSLQNRFVGVILWTLVVFLLRIFFADELFVLHVKLT